MVRLQSYVLLGFTAFALAAASPATKRRTPLIKDSLPQVPRGWTLHRAAPAHHMIKLRIGLPQSNFAELEKALHEVSDPAHPRYGAHLSKEEVEELVAPHPESLDLVEDWLISHGFDVATLDRSPAKDWITIIVPVHQAESMLDTKYNVYKHEATGMELVRTQSYSLPEYLFEHVDVIQPTTMFGGGMRAMDTTSHIELDDSEPGASAAADDCTNTRITVACLQDLYKTKGYVPKVPGKNKIGITGYLEQYANFADLKQFYQAYVPAAVDSKFDVKLIHGGKNDQNLSLAGEEANLDVQYAGGISYPTPNIFWSTGGSPPFIPDLVTPTNTNEPYADWLDYVLGLSAEELPQTITTSYGDDEQTVPRDYAIRVCNELAQLGARGVTLFYSSGDFGVGGNNKTRNTCITNDGTNTVSFLPAFPASCPYVTAVGGTTNLTEVAVNFSGGGFSNYFPTPDYQKKEVESYLEKIGSTYDGLYNRTGRGYPDVAALGTSFRIIYQGRDVGIGGTSASSPAFAAVISLVNDALIAKGRPPLGWLNPWLYSTGYAALNDITSGSNPGCNTTGFAAGPGWDPVTGFGSPNFEKILALLDLEK
ncbi:hypothetical protein BOTBODRAFT_37586 [Botryobasidium botryosum FD-172 SS1]|uniref:tripeptidyl-peptidase II n=1 Tax=Botryobasidium botryosum (strain FD-172 SS1) TaxID=930990 RepID=A0A067LZL4_BOTB1|nr:hypothetical protein BOTBODRAFT_37586 [Botryobasidium botryosum FD-172 SS1]